MLRSLLSALGKHALTGIQRKSTRGLVIANSFAAGRAGHTTFASSPGVIGGCPFAAGASGNIVTEDLVFMFEAMGVKTGIDLEALFAVREYLQGVIGDEPLYGFAPLAGLPLGFTPATIDRTGATE